MTYMWNLKNKMNECIKNKRTNIGNKPVVTSRQREREGQDGEGIKRYKLRDTNSLFV